MATIYDVARAAGVSAKTVSRVLNGDGPVGAATREAVEKAMREMGYVPSNAARMMRASKSGLIGLITGAITTVREATQPAGLPDLFIVQGIQAAMAQADMTVMIADTGGHQDKVPRLIDTFLSHRVEGLIYVAEYHQQVSLPPVPPSTPLVLANCFDDIGTPAILPDDERGQHELVARLIRAGHTRIAYLTLRDEIEATRLRSLGYRTALAEAGLAYDPNLVRPCDLNGHEAETQLIWDAIDQMLRLPDPPTVFCCGNDKMALKVYGILRSRGLRLPDEICVAGYDNYHVIAETLYPPLTTVELPYFAMGVRAGQRLLSLISGQGREDRSPTLVSGSVQWRASVTERTPINVTQLRSIREETPK
ncbi:MAG: LacI family DNA-binding transcriptional regulator [bacterium]